MLNLRNIVSQRNISRRLCRIQIGIRLRLSVAHITVSLSQRVGCRRSILRHGIRQVSHGRHGWRIRNRVSLLLCIRQLILCERFLRFSIIQKGRNQCVIRILRSNLRQRSNISLNRCQVILHLRDLIRDGVISCRFSSCQVRFVLGLGISYILVSCRLRIIRRRLRSRCRVNSRLDICWHLGRINSCQLILGRR